MVDNTTGSYTKAARTTNEYTTTPDTSNAKMPSTTQSVVSDISCTFETDTCGWVQDANDTFDWSRRQRPSELFRTGK